MCGCAHVAKFDMRMPHACTQAGRQAAHASIKTSTHAYLFTPAARLCELDSLPGRSLHLDVLAGADLPSTPHTNTNNSSRHQWNSVVMPLRCNLAVAVLDAASDAEDERLGSSGCAATCVSRACTCARTYATVVPSTAACIELPVILTQWECWTSSRSRRACNGNRSMVSFFSTTAPATAGSPIDDIISSRVAGRPALLLNIIEVVNGEGQHCPGILEPPLGFCPMSEMKGLLSIRIASYSWTRCIWHGVSNSSNWYCAASSRKFFRRLASIDLWCSICSSLAPSKMSPGTSTSLPISRKKCSGEPVKVYFSVKSLRMRTL